MDTTEPFYFPTTDAFHAKQYVMIHDRARQLVGQLAVGNKGWRHCTLQKMEETFLPMENSDATKTASFVLAMWIGAIEMCRFSFPGSINVFRVEDTSFIARRLLR